MPETDDPQGAKAIAALLSEAGERLVREFVVVESSFTTCPDELRTWAAADGLWK